MKKQYYIEHKEQYKAYYMKNNDEIRKTQNQYKVDMKRIAFIIKKILLLLKKRRASIIWKRVILFKNESVSIKWKTNSRLEKCIKITTYTM